MQLHTSLVIAILFLVSSCFAVKDYLFKSCEQNGFCHRNRHYAKEITLDPNFISPYSVSPESISIEDSIIKGIVVKQLPHIDTSVEFPFEVSILCNSFHFKLDENRESKQQVVNHQRYNETVEWAFVDGVDTNREAKFNKDERSIDVSYGHNKVTIEFHPVKLTFFHRGNEVLVVNDKQFLNIEHQRSKEDNEDNVLPQETTFNMFSDNFADSKNDKLPLGPESIGLDFNLKGFSNLYGIPEHADSLLLKDTSGREPYRLYNVDIFEYETDSRLPMYGSIPLLMAVNAHEALGIFWVNSADSYIDITRQQDSTVHWMSENGVLEFVIIIGESPQKVNEEYGKLTGNVQLPILASLGYHQCRWNYNDIKDVLEVSSKFDEFEIPYDTIWLDIEYADNKKYFTWDSENFGDPAHMLKVLNRTGRNLAVIIDPHIKTGYEVSDAIVSQNLAMKNNENEVYYGHCWPGESVWIDTLNPKSQSFWNELHKTFMISDEHKNLFLWNDMNEPSVFNGPETSAPKDNLHYGQWEHRSIHNLNGLTYHEATYKSLIDRLPTQRPFILTRSYFAGSQRTAAMWTGDNMSKWEYLKISIPMVLTSNIVGMPFAGADVGGFFGNPSGELLTRWYQAGIWYPFFRAHAHIDSRRREPYLLGDPFRSYVKDAIRLRYKLLPVFYTSFHQASLTGAPVLKPVFYDYKDSTDDGVYDIEDEFFLGNSGILAKPVTDEGAKQVSFAAPKFSNENFFEFTNGIVSGKVYHDRLSAELSDVPMLLKGGSVVPMKNRYRRSSRLMRHDPYTLVVALDKNGRATGNLYVDDGESLNSEYKLLTFIVDKEGISLSSTGDYAFSVSIEKIIIVGADFAIDTVSSGRVISESEKITIVDPKEFPVKFGKGSLSHDEL
ncbi:ROT2 [Candida theae]|uniref:Glucosidase II subunit alpha n=1 Tax=Candida theae TaxID=1198502 RepID=A0AAD5BH09_9ASCO|nr:ROT2 [Candida theae]KAI5962047.1 ROT2 [Candida theae]